MLHHLHFFLKSFALAVELPLLLQQRHRLVLFQSCTLVSKLFFALLFRFFLCLLPNLSHLCLRFFQLFVGLVTFSCDFSYFLVRLLLGKLGGSFFSLFGVLANYPFSCLGVFSLLGSLITLRGHLPNLLVEFLLCEFDRLLLLGLQLFFELLLRAETNCCLRL